MAASTPPTVHTYDPELTAYAAELPALDLVDYETTRGATRRSSVELPQGVGVDGMRVPAGDARSVPVRVYRPPGSARRQPVIVHFHAGGYVTGSVDGSHAHCAHLSANTGAMVVSVGYRLAPEHPFPCAFDDGVAVLDWLHERAGELAIDPTRLALHGRSAGAGLAARVAIESRERGYGVRLQYLNCPQLDPAAISASMTAFTDTAFVTADTIRTSWRHYLGPEEGRDNALLANASPSHAADLTRLPPAYIAVMEFDPLRDEGIAYAQRLLLAGVPVELHTFPGTFHCSAVVAPWTAVSRRELAEEVEVLCRALQGEPI